MRKYVSRSEILHPEQNYERLTGRLVRR